MTLFQDVRFALRQLRKSLGFAATVLLTLALGIGANVAIFTLINVVLLQRLPVANPASLVRVGDQNVCCVNSGLMTSGDYSLFSTDTYTQLRKNNPEFEELAAMEAGFSYRPITVRGGGNSVDSRSLMGEFVSGNYFRTFGLRPAWGRVLSDADDVEGAPMTMVVSYRAWQNEYGGGASIVGSTFWVNTMPVTIIGVAPEGFYGDRLSSTPPDFFLPIESMPSLMNSAYVHSPETEWLYIIGRVKPGVALPGLQQKLSAQVRQIFGQQREFMTADGKAVLPRVHVVLTPGGAGIQAMQEGYSSQLRLLMWVTALVLLIACANIANLLLVRGVGRRAELSLRTALGAPRGRIIRQLLTESVMLAGLGGIAGLAVAYVGTRMLLALAFPDATGLPISAVPSTRVVAFAVGLSVVTGILFGLSPAWLAARTQPADVLRSGARTTRGGVSVLQRGLVVLQAAVSLILLVGAALFSSSLGKLERSDMKLDARNRYIVHINPQAAGYATTQVEALYRLIEQRFHELPGVVNVGLATYTPMEDNNWSNSVQIQGQPDPKRSASFVKVNDEYFNSVGTKLVMGREFGPKDTAAAPSVVVVNQAFLKTFIGDHNPIGMRMGAPGPASSGDFEIVGVVEDTAYSSVRWKNHGMYFVPLVQRPASNKQPASRDLSMYAGAMVIETSHPFDGMQALTQRTLASINPNLTVVKFQTFASQIADRFTQERLIARLTELFGGLALLLAAIGLYGVTAYGVRQRTVEIGIRTALGASRTGVMAMVLRGAMQQTAIGLAVGIPVALFCVRFVRSQLYEIAGVDMATMFAAIAVLALATGIAGAIPAWGAASIEPVKALRSE